MYIDKFYGKFPTQHKNNNYYKQELLKFSQIYFSHFSEYLVSI